MSDPKDKTPLTNPPGIAAVDATEQDVITNTEAGNKIVNDDSAVTETDEITVPLSESEPATVVNTDNKITNNDDGRSEDSTVIN